MVKLLIRLQLFSIRNLQLSLLLPQKRLGYFLKLSIRTAGLILLSQLCRNWRLNFQGNSSFWRSWAGSSRRRWRRRLQPPCSSVVEWRGTGLTPEQSGQSDLMQMKKKKQKRQEPIRNFCMWLSARLRMCVEPSCRLSQDGRLMIWVNIDDHLRLVSHRDDANVAEAFKRVFINLQKVSKWREAAFFPFTRKGE